MKRLMSVMVLAGVPVACGIETSSTPDAVIPAADVASASVSAQSVRRGKPACVTGDRSEVQRIQLVVVDQGAGFVTVRAQIAQTSADTYPPVCLEPFWQVKPSTRLDPFTDREEVTVYGAPGRYQLTGTSLVPDGPKLRATLAIVIK